MSVDSDVAILGAGPYGLAVASHLRNAGVDAHVFGRPMSFWQEQMPVGMLLRSNWSATNIADRHGELNLDSYQADSGASFRTPVPLAEFVEYGLWFQRHAVPDVDTRLVTRVEQEGSNFRLELDDGQSTTASRVIVAAGIGPFAAVPPTLAGLPAELVSHSSAHQDLGTFAGREVLVVGGGQSALESAALLHESGASVEVVARAERLVWLRGGTIHRRLGRAVPIFYGPTDVGPFGISRLMSEVGLTRRIPKFVMRPLERRSIRPAGSRWLVDRLADVPLTTGRVITDAAQVDGNGRVRVMLDDGTERTADHVLCGTGYRVDVERYSFLPPELTQKIDRVSGYPRLGGGYESSVPGLHFVGAPSAFSYGAVMRFVSGTWYTGQTLVRAIGPKRRKNRPATRPVEAPAPSRD